MLGPGKYDELCTETREKAEAVGAIIAIFRGNKGTGFSCQAPIAIQLVLPNILRDMADQIEKDLVVKWHENTEL